MKLTIILFILFFLLFVYEFIHGIVRQNNRNNYFKMAQTRSRELNKPLVVVGDPYNGIGSIIYNMFMEGYGCGDETVDLTGVPRCPNGIKQDILSYLSSKESNSCVLFISCVLEYVDEDEIDDIIRQIKRVAGSLKNVFIVSINKDTLSARFYLDKNCTSKRIVFGPPEHGYKNITYIKV
jgi:hypothetical protein